MMIEETIIVIAIALFSVVVFVFMNLFDSNRQYKQIAEFYKQEYRKEREYSHERIIKLHELNEEYKLRLHDSHKTRIELEKKIVEMKK